MTQILHFPKRLGLHNSVKSIPPLKTTRFSDSIGGTGLIMESKAYPMSRVIEAGVDLTQFEDDDYRYVPNFDVIFVQKGSKLYTWLTMKL